MHVPKWVQAKAYDCFKPFFCLNFFLQKGTLIKLIAILNDKLKLQLVTSLKLDRVDLKQEVRNFKELSFRYKVLNTNG